MTKKLLVKFYWDCGRMGDIEGLFVTTQEKLNSWYNRYICFGEVSGKHSEISGQIDPEDFTIKSDDQEFITKIEELLGSHLSGFYPGYYLEDESDKSKESEDE